ncbi:Torsin-1B [Dirofilaria immitis]|nr:Torsin-1B [Dirofilaria immitis]
MSINNNTDYDHEYLRENYFVSLVYGEPLSFLVGTGSAIAASLGIFNYYFRCKIFECCDSSWVRGDYTGLQHSMRTRLYGQHLAKETIITAAIAHWENPNPKKALVMSFHGWTGCGKNYLSSMIIDSLYRKGMKSDYVHIYVSTLHFSNYLEIPLYQVQLRSWIQGNVSKCERSLFVFDEVDKMPAKVIDALKPFIDHYEYLEGIDFRKSIFVFLSNSGSNEIAQKALQHYENGKIRETITLKEMEDVVMKSAFNTEDKFCFSLKIGNRQKSAKLSPDCGLKMSELISAHLIDHFIPFLPLERKHILLCIRDYMLSHEFTPTDERITAIADSLQYFPKTNPIYSSSGCKRVAQKTELFMSAERERDRQRFESFHDDDVL